LSSTFQRYFELTYHIGNIKSVISATQMEQVSAIF